MYPSLPIRKTGGVDGIAKVSWARTSPSSEWPLEGSSFPANAARPLSPLIRPPQTPLLYLVFHKMAPTRKAFGEISGLGERGTSAENTMEQLRGRF